MNVYPWQSSHTTTVIRKACEWHHLKLCMDEGEEKVRVIQNHLKTAQSRQKSYSDKRHRPLAFEVGKWAYLRVSPTKGVHRFGVKGKLAPALYWTLPNPATVWTRGIP